MNWVLRAVGLVALLVAWGGCDPYAGIRVHQPPNEQTHARQATYRAYHENEDALTKAQNDLKIQRTCRPDAEAACGALTEKSWRACQAPVCSTDACRSRWFASASTSLADRYFAADQAYIEGSCRRAPATCGDLRTLEGAFFRSHNERIPQIVDVTRIENKKQLDAADSDAMNAFSRGLNDKLEEWRATVRSAPSCPEVTKSDVLPAPPPATPFDAYHLGGKRTP
jgi:hypothetical protein